MDGESSEWMVEDEVAGVGRDESDCRSQSGWCEVVGEQPEADSRDELNHTERNGL